MQSYTLFLNGPSGDDGLPGGLVRDLLDAVDDGARGAVRLRLEGRSRAGGGIPAGWVAAAARYEVVRILPRGAGIELRAPTLAEAVPERFAQGDLFPFVDAGDTPLSLLRASLRDALAGNADSDAFDEPLLSTFEDFRRVFRHGVNSVEIRNAAPGSPAVAVTPEGLQTVHRLKRQTPRPRRVRIAGKLDEIRHSDRAFTLLLESGEQIRGVLVDGEPNALAQHFGSIAVVSGTAHFRPSGALLRVEAENLATGDEEDAVAWGAMPLPLDAHTDSRTLRQPQGPRSGINAVIGTWPGDESDEEVFRILEEIS